MWIDVGSLIRNRTPDRNGKPLPLDVGSGSYEFRDLTNHGVGSLFEGKVVYDTTYGQVTYGCASCCGYYTPVLLWNPLGIPLQFTAGNGVQSLNFCVGVYEDVSSAFDYNWSTANSSIATVDSYGTHTGMAVGSTTSQTYGYLQRPSLHCPLFMGHPNGGDNVASVSCTPSSVTRGNRVTCTASGGSTFSNWEFTDANQNVVMSSQSNGSWSGTMVTGGTVSVIVDGTFVSAAITVTNRTGSAWTFSPAPATQENNGFICSSSGPTLSIPSPPSASFSENGTTVGDLGTYCNTDGSSFNTATVNDGGPNNGYQYVTSVSPGSSSLPWAYYYVISPDLQNASSAFSLAQCGNYNAQTNPNGFITQPNLLSNTTRHESGSTASHYAKYTAAVNASANNPGIVTEQQVGTPGLTVAQFDGNVATALNSAGTNINSATNSPEPPGPNYTASGTFQGYTNFLPYASCH